MMLKMEMCMNMLNLLVTLCLFVKHSDGSSMAHFVQWHDDLPKMGFTLWLPQSYHADGDDFFTTHQHGDALGMVYAIGFTPRKPHWMMIYDLFTTGSVPTLR